MIKEAHWFSQLSVLVQITYTQLLHLFGFLLIVFSGTEATKASPTNAVITSVFHRMRAHRMLYLTFLKPSTNPIEYSST